MADVSQKPLLDPEDADRAPQPGQILAGKYRVESVVGMGGMGVVVAAQHVTLGQTVAVKLLTVVGLDEARRVEACARFVREGQAAARLTSDHVVRIHDVGTLDDGTPFMVMELLRGDDLSTIIQRQGTASPEMAVEYVVQACDAVGEAHSFGIVHRDLKPSNLFVSRRGDGHPVVKVLDFGISKAMATSEDPFQGSLTATRSVVGSPYYMSPEQVRDAKRVDARSDIWSLGMILYELLVGEPAFHADTLPGICAAIAADAPVPVRERRPDVPPALEAIVMRCLDKDPARRFPTVIELVRALAPFLPQGSAVSTADYTSRRLEDSAAKLQALRRYPADQLTIQNASDSGMRLSTAESDPPFQSGSVQHGQSALVAAGALPAAPVGGTPGDALAGATLQSAQGHVAIRDATLQSRTGTSLRADADASGVARLAPPAASGAPRTRWLVAGAVLLVGSALLLLASRGTPQASPPAEEPRLHEPVGPSPPALTAHAEVPTPPVAGIPEPPSPVAAASARGTTVASPSQKPHLVPGTSTPARAPKAVAQHPGAKPAPMAAPPADIRLER